jgi:uncharacterized protein YodC (DUF2158 family)
MAQKNVPPFKKGDVVVLISDGPPMAVMRVERSVSPGLGDGGYSITCQWFSGKKAERETFPHESLRLHKKDGGDAE